MITRPAGQDACGRAKRSSTRTAAATRCRCTSERAHARRQADRRAVAKILIDGGAYRRFGLVTTYYAGQLLTGPHTISELPVPTRRASSPTSRRAGPSAATVRCSRASRSRCSSTGSRCWPGSTRSRCGAGTSRARTRRTVNGQRITSNGFAQCLDQVEARAAGRRGAGSSAAAAGSASPARCTSAGTELPASTPTTMPQAGRADHGRPLAASSPSSPAANDIGQGSNTCRRLHRGRGARHATSATCASSRPTRDLCPVDLGAYSARASRSWSATRRSTPRARSREQVVAGGRAGVGDRAQARARSPAASSSISTTATACCRRAKAFQLAEARFDTLGATGSYNTPNLGGDYRGGTIGAAPAYSFTGARRRGRGRRGDRRASAVPRVWTCARLRPRAQSDAGRGPDRGLGLHGRRRGRSLEDHDVNRMGLHARPNLLDYTHPDLARLRPSSTRCIVESIDPEGRTARRRRAKARCIRRSRRSPTRSSTRAASGSQKLPFTPAKVLAALAEARTAKPRPPSPRREGALTMLRLQPFDFVKPKSVDETAGAAREARPRREAARGRHRRRCRT